MANGVDKDKVPSCYAQEEARMKVGLPTPNDGGPAFPSTFEDRPVQGTIVTRQVISEGGMSLRDYFAGQAIVALGCEAIRKMDTANKKQNLPVSLTWEHFAMNAYEIADAMIAQRNKEQGDGI